MFAEPIYLVNGILTRYIAIHDELLRFSWRRIVPVPGIFKKIDYPKSRDGLLILAVQLKEVCDLPEDESIPPVFAQYVDALLKTITALQIICSRLADKADGSTYSMADYKSDTTCYKAQRAEYIRLGDDLNQQLECTN